jgi:hypothetical protein
VIVGSSAETVRRPSLVPRDVPLSGLGVLKGLVLCVDRSEAEYRAVGVHVDHSASTSGSAAWNPWRSFAARS